MRFAMILGLTLAGCDCGSSLARVPSELVADARAIDFGTLAPSTTATRSLVVRNEARATVTVNGQEVSGAGALRFVITSASIGRLRTGEEATVSITFTAPDEPDTVARAELIIESDAANPRLTVLLTGASAVLPADGGIDGGPVADGGSDDGGCRPRGCLQAAAECGMVDDLCQGQLDCGTCSGPEVCGGAGQPNVCGAPGSCPTVAAPSLAGPSSQCALRMPPSAGVPCDMATPGTQFYVSATTGNDSNDGLSPTTPWQSLCKALGTATSGSTVRVAEGMYLTAEVAIGRSLTLKGGYDTTFTTWNPDAHHSIIAGRVKLSDDNAVLGGFRLIRRGRGDEPHIVRAGKLVRNYFELLLDPAHHVQTEFWHSSGIIAAADPGKRVTLACNDIYGRNIPALGGAPSSLTLMNVGRDFGEGGPSTQHNGDTVIDSNRACLDDYRGADITVGVSGHGGCGAGAPASITLTNNILDGREEWSTGLWMTGCRNTLQVVVTNNTILGNSNVLGGADGESGALVNWRLTNNVFAGRRASHEAFQIQSAGSHQVLSAEGNLTFGFADLSLTPTPATFRSNEFSTSATLAATFVDWVHGDFRPLASGPAAEGGVNVLGNPLYGMPTRDLRQQDRPDAGSWARGALLP